MSLGHQTVIRRENILACKSIENIMSLLEKNNAIIKKGTVVYPCHCFATSLEQMIIFVQKGLDRINTVTYPQGPVEELLSLQQITRHYELAMKVASLLLLEVKTIEELERVGVLWLRCSNGFFTTEQNQQFRQEYHIKRDTMLPKWSIYLRIIKGIKIWKAPEDRIENFFHSPYEKNIAIPNYCFQRRVV